MRSKKSLFFLAPLGSTPEPAYLEEQADQFHLASMTSSQGMGKWEQGTVLQQKPTADCL